MINNRFIVITPVYNAEDYIYTSISSVQRQQYDNFFQIVINDGSTDNTGKIIVDDFLKSKHIDYKYKISLIDNKTKHCPLFSIWQGIQAVGFMNEPDDAIVVIVDGDDKLIDSYVLSYLNELYQDENLWLTYGSFICFSNGQRMGINRPVKDTRTYRKEGFTQWRTSHLRTFRLHLWNRIKEEDLKVIGTNMFYPYAGDLASMYPMVEMAGNRRIKYIDKILYVYNDLNPLNEHKVDVSAQWACAREITERRQPYEEIK